MSTFLHIAGCPHRFSIIANLVAPELIALLLAPFQTYRLHDPQQKILTVESTSHDKTYFASINLPPTHYAIVKNEGFLWLGFLNPDCIDDGGVDPKTYSKAHDLIQIDRSSWQQVR